MKDEKPRLLLIDGGSIYQRLIDRLSECYCVKHTHSPAEGLHYANQNFHFDGIIVDLLQSWTKTDDGIRPSLVGLWIVDQLREFTSSHQLPILVVSHWQQSLIVTEMNRQSIDDSGYNYLPMSDTNAIVKFFQKHD